MLVWYRPSITHIIIFFYLLFFSETNYTIPTNSTFFFAYHSALHSCYDQTISLKGNGTTTEQWTVTEETYQTPYETNAWQQIGS